MSQTAMNLQQTEAKAARQQYLTFRLADEQYGVEILRVQTIQGWERVTPLPGTPDYVLGVINLRGAVVPIVDLKQRFGLPDGERGRTTVVVIVRMEGTDRERIIGLVADAVCDVCDVSEQELRPAPEIGDRTGTEYLKGLAQIDERMVILLDVDRLVSQAILGTGQADSTLH